MSPSGSNSCRSRAVLFPLFILLPLLGALPGVLAGRWYYTSQTQGKFARWQPLPAPPQPAEELLAADTNSIYVRTATGLYYCANVAGCLKDLAECWQPVGEVVENWPGSPRYGPDFNPQYRPPPPPVAPAQELAVSLRRAETYDETYYLRSSSGEIWVWRWGSLSFFTIGLTLLVYCGSVCWCSGAGLALAWVIVIKLKY